MNGPAQNTSIMYLDLDESNSISVIAHLDPVDISVNPVDDEIFILTRGSSILSVSSGTIFTFDSGVPTALDVFEVFAYVVFESGMIAQVTIQEGMNVYLISNHFNLIFCIEESVRVLGNINGSVDIEILHPLKKSYYPSKCN